MRDLRRRGLVAAATGLSIASLAPRRAMASDLALLLDPPPQPWGSPPAAALGARRGYVINGAQFSSTGSFRITLTLAPWPDDLGGPGNTWYVLAVYGTIASPQSSGGLYQLVTSGVLYQSPPVQQTKEGGPGIDRALVKQNPTPDRGYFIALYTNTVSPQFPDGPGYASCSVDNEAQGHVDFRTALDARFSTWRPLLQRVTFSAR